VELGGLAQQLFGHFDRVDLLADDDLESHLACSYA
jgi:hypothetical protein